jgi:hypothetical protein
MNTESASVLHRFVSLANEPDYLALGWVRERHFKPPVQNFGVWLNMALHHLPARRAALGGCVRRLVASLPAVADPRTQHRVRPQ